METNARFQNLLVECKSEMDFLGIPYDRNVMEIEVNRRAKGRWGQCKRIRGKHYIDLSEMLLQGHNKAIKETIIHEMIHTIAGCMNHGVNFKHYCEKMNHQYGYNIKRVNNASEKGVPVEAKEKAYKYVITCNTCDTKSFYGRRAAVFDRLNVCSCNKCKTRGNFNITQNF